MTSSPSHSSIVLPATVCEQAARHLERAAQKSIDGAAAAWHAFHGTDDCVFPVPMVEQAAGCLLVLAAESAQSLRPSALRALITVALYLRDAAEAVRRPAFTSGIW